MNAHDSGTGSPVPSEDQEQISKKTVEITLLVNRARYIAREQVQRARRFPLDDKSGERMHRAVILLVGLTLLAVLPVLAQAPKEKQQQKSAATKTAPKTASRALTLKQIEQLLSVRTPDSVVAQEIRGRGVVETITKQVVAALKARGAGPLTLTAVTKLIPRSTLTVRTSPGAEVILDGSSAGFAGPDGQMVLADLDPGTHGVEVRKTNFRPRSSSIQLLPNRPTSLDAELDWAVGFVTASANIPDAQLQVSGGLTQTGSITRMAVPIGFVTVVARAELRKTVSQTVAIEPGKEATVMLSLPWDEAALNGLANQIHSSFVSRLYQVVLQKAAQYLQTGARDKDVLGEIAISNLELNRYAEFKNTAREALAAGATLRFQMQHHHAGLRITMHPAVLQVTSRALGFQPEGNCNIEPFEVPLNQVRFGSRNSVILPSHQTGWALNLIVPNPSNPKKESTINLAKDREWLSPQGHNQIATIREFLEPMTH